MSKIFQIYGNDSHDMTMKLLDESHAIELVPSGGNVALKPNLVISGRAEQGAVTHSGILSGCIEYFRDNGVHDISIIEGSWLGDETMRAMRTAGYDEVCMKYDVPFYDLKKDSVRRVKTAIGDMEICSRALDAGLLVNLPVLKGHGQTKMTCALKNLKGCLPDKEKRRFHALGLTKPIAALGAYLRPRLTVVDSICGDLNFEEGGTPVHTNRMYLGTDPVQLDSYGRSLMGLMPEDVKYIELAEKYGGGSSQWSESDIVLLNQPVESSDYPKPSGIVSRLTKHVHQDKACSSCFAALVRALYTSGMGSRSEIYIGQGWTNKKINGLGIGKCCKNAPVCVMGCPPNADEIAKVLTEM